MAVTRSFQPMLVVSDPTDPTNGTTRTVKGATPKTLHPWESKEFFLKNQVLVSVSVGPQSSSTSAQVAHVASRPPQIATYAPWPFGVAVAQGRHT